MSLLSTSKYEVNWCKGPLGWFNLTTVALPGFLAGGVYIIFQASSPYRVVRVGQGIISERLREHRSNSNILRHQNPNLLVTWALVPEHLRDGVERYLANAYSPIEGEQFPNCAPIAVNLPR